MYFSVKILDFWPKTTQKPLEHVSAQYSALPHRLKPNNTVSRPKNTHFRTVGKWNYTRNQNSTSYIISEVYLLFIQSTYYFLQLIFFVPKVPILTCFLLVINVFPRCFLRILWNCTKLHWISWNHLNFVFKSKKSLSSSYQIIYRWLCIFRV